MNMDQQKPETQTATAHRRRQHHQPPPPPPPPRKCPRCDSSNTKFCYYNNYSLSQPRYFCKTCRRHWTQGGAIRNIPIGGGCRQSKRLKTSSSSRVDVAVTQGLSLAVPNQNPIPVAQPLRPLPPVITSAVDPFFTGGAILPSMGSMQSFTGEFNQGAGVNLGGGSNQFSANTNPFQMISLPPLRPPAARQFQPHGDFFLQNPSLIPPRPSGSWSQNLINTSAASSQGLINCSGNNSSFWGCNNSSDGDDLVAPSSSLSRNPWPDNNWGFSPSPH